MTVMNNSNKVMKSSTFDPDSDDVVQAAHPV